MTINNNINPLYIFESEEINSIKDVSSVYIWNGHQDKKNCISIPKYLEKNSDKFKKKYIKFIHDLGQKNILNKNLTQHLHIKDNYNLWWMSLLTEKSHYKSPRIKDCLKLFALEEIILKNKPSKIILYFSDKIIIRSIKILSKNLGIGLIIKRISINKNYKNKSRSILNFIYFKSPYITQAFIYLFKHILVYWPLKKTKKAKWFTKDKKIFFFSYLFHLDHINYKNGKFKTSQWGPVTNLLNELSIKSNWMHHYVTSPIISNTNVGINFIDKLNDNPNENGAHQFLLKYLNIKIVLKVIINYLKILLKFSILFKIRNSFVPENSNISFWHLLKNDFLNSIIGPKLVENLLWIELFDYTFANIPHQEKGIYLQENQGWEKAFITSWKNHNHGELLALNNGFVRYWDTRFFDDPRTIKDLSNTKMPIPDRIIITDSVSWSCYIETGYSANKLLKAETIRYFDTCIRQSWEKQNFFQKNDGEIKSDNKLKALILGDIVYETTNTMITTLENINNKKFKWVLKSHPACLINIKNYKKIKLENSYENLKDIISKFDLVIAPAATLSVLEAYLSNVKIIIYLGKNELNLSPLRDFPNIKIVYDDNTMEKALSLESLKNYSVEKQDLFWFDKNLVLWKKVLS